MSDADGRSALLIANSSWYLLNFRGSLIRGLLDRGWRVTAAAPRSEHSQSLSELGCGFLHWDLSGGSYAPLNAPRAFIQLLRIQRRVQPSLVHTFTIKPALMASLVAPLAGDRPPVISITGLGHAFLGGRARRRLAESLYGLCLRRDSPVVFQNEDDRKHFLSRRLIERAQAHLIRGSGVDTDRFAPRGTVGTGTVRALYIGRMLREKGIVELIAAGELLRGQGVDVEILLAGGTQLGNPSSLAPAELEASTAVRWLGEVIPVDDLLASADMLVLPSWREGLPRTVIEAMAMGKPVVATDVPGCRDAVRDGETGILVPKEDPASLAAAIARLAADEELRRTMGAAARRIAVDGFRQEVIVAQTLELYGDYLGK